MPMDTIYWNIQNTEGLMTYKDTVLFGDNAEVIGTYSSSSANTSFKGVVINKTKSTPY